MDFPDRLDFSYASQMKKDVEELFAKGGAISFDLRNVERSSLACVQIIVAAYKEAARRDISLEIKSSDALKQMYKDLGLNEILNSNEGKA